MKIGWPWLTRLVIDDIRNEENPGAIGAMLILSPISLFIDIIGAPFILPCVLLGYVVKIVRDRFFPAKTCRTCGIEKGCPRRGALFESCGAWTRRKKILEEVGTNGST